MNQRYGVLFACLAVAAVTFLVFSSTIGFEFVNWDDDIYVYSNPVITPFSPETALRIFSQFYYYAYIPVTLLSHAADVAWWGMDPHGHHLSNVMIHSMNALWVMLLGLTISGVRSARAGAAAGWRHRHSLAVITGFAVGAVLFALHPLRMESVAWVSDRKDLLCAFFAVPSLIAYLAYISRSGSSSARRWYGASFILFVLAALSKSIAVVLPVIFLLVDWALADDVQWNSRRKGLVVAKLPFLLVSSIITVLLLQMSPDGKRAYAVADLDIPGTILFPFYAFSFYLEKLVVPAGLLPIYPSVGTGRLLAGLAVVAGVSAVCLLLKGKQRRFAILAWSSYLLLLFPTVAGLSSGMQPVADRYSYLPTIGLFLLLGGAISAALSRWSGVPRWCVVAVCALATVLAGTLTATGLGNWRNSETLWEHVIGNAPQTREYADAYINLGTAYSGQQRFEEARAMFETALQLDAGNPDAFYNLGYILYVMGNDEESSRFFLKATEADPSHARAFFNLGIVLSRLGNDDRAEEAVRQAARLGLEEAQNALRERGLEW